MKSLIIAFVCFLGFSIANAATNLTQVMATLPGGGYLMDMGVDENGLFSITDLKGNPIPGYPFTVNPIPAPTGAGPAGSSNGTLTKTPDLWGCNDPEEVNQADWTWAGGELSFWCYGSNMVPKKRILYWIKNDSIAYICNYVGAQNCLGTEYWSYMQDIASWCGANTCGWFLQGSGNKSYGRGIKGGLSDPLKVCSNIQN
ncbi:hypothetical protein PG994_006625 [Apiospora phragmitis]|uniref:Uncharacterized protein n=1 Tax=Apiospora phragmitis TaxID=2905665 RepID=A0ABR1VJ70_9PEZI